jgi:hypothetical protein
MPTAVTFRCSCCRARIKAPFQIVGQSRACPGCGHNFVVPKVIPPDAETVLVLDDSGPSMRLRPRFRTA